MTQATTTVYKPYGFDPGFIENIQGKMKWHFTAAQAIRTLGISKCKFYQDIKKGRIMVRRMPGDKKRFFTGRELLDYYLDSFKH